MEKRLDKYVERAFSECGYNLLADINTVDDLHNYVKTKKEQISQAQQIIEDMKELIEDCNNDIAALEQIIYQVKVEKYKDLNPGVEVF